MRHCAYKFIFQLFQDFNRTNIFTITGKIRESLNFKKGLAPAGPKIKMKSEQYNRNQLSMNHTRNFMGYHGMYILMYL